MQDLIDLCRLNLMEENIEKSVHPDRDLTLTLIEDRKRRLARKIIASNPPVEQAVIDKHIKSNTVNGEYVGEGE